MAGFHKDNRRFFTMAKGAFFIPIVVVFTSGCDSRIVFNDGGLDSGIGDGGADANDTEAKNAVFSTPDFITVEWNPSTDDEVDRYYIYSGSAEQSVIGRLGSNCETITCSSFQFTTSELSIDSCCKIMGNKVANFKFAFPAQADSKPVYFAVRSSKGTSQGMGNKIVSSELTTETRENMALVRYPFIDNGGKVYQLFVDRYEAGKDASGNYSNAKGSDIYNYVNKAKARAGCRSSGKRLLTFKEFVVSASWKPSPDDFSQVSFEAIEADRDKTDGYCNSNFRDQPFPKTGSSETRMCVSWWGIQDLTGNVWEWLEESLVDGIPRKNDIDDILSRWTIIPQSGYVKNFDFSLWQFSETDPAQDISYDTYNKDRFWVEKMGIQEGTAGGDYGDGQKGGRFCFSLSEDAGLEDISLGFRCALPVY